MNEKPAPAGRTWARAAGALARRVERRRRRGVAFTRLGWSLLVAAGLALLWRAAAPPLDGIEGTAIVLALLAAGLLVGAVLALAAQRRTPPVREANAAWALDRLARVDGRGLAAAAAGGPAASEAAFAGDGLSPPPTVRLHPPRGLALVVGAALLAVLAVLAPGRGDASDDEVDGGDAVRIAGPGDGAADATGAAARHEAKARALDARAGATRAVREALDLPPDGPLDAREVADRLADPEARRRAEEAAGSDAELAALLNNTDTSSASAARAIAGAEDNRAAASQTRREAAGARARLGVPTVPPARRDVVQQYLRLIDRARER